MRLSMCLSVPRSVCLSMCLSMCMITPVCVCVCISVFIACLFFAQSSLARSSNHTTVGRMSGAEAHCNYELWLRVQFSSTVNLSMSVCNQIHRCHFVFDQRCNFDFCGPRSLKKIHFGGFWCPRQVAAAFWVVGWLCFDPSLLLIWILCCHGVRSY